LVERGRSERRALGRVTSQGRMSASAPSLTISVPGYTDVTGHTEYIIKSSAGEQQFAVQHRFSNFIELHEALITKMAKLPAAFPVPKSMFSGESVKRERVEKLQEYLRNVVRLSGERPPAALLKFLRVDTAVFAPLSSGGTGSGGAPTGGGPQLLSSEPLQTFQPFSGPQGAFAPERPEDINEALREGIKAGDSPLCLELIEAKADPLYRDRQGEETFPAVAQQCPLSYANARCVPLRCADSHLSCALQ